MDRQVAFLQYPMSACIGAAEGAAMRADDKGFRGRVCGNATHHRVRLRQHAANRPPAHAAVATDVQPVRGRHPETTGTGDPG